ncbi:MAG: YibE/F family protein [Eubacteriales bacterium]
MKKAVYHILFLLLYIALLWGFNKCLDFERPADYPEGVEYAKATVIEVIEEDMGVDPDYDYISIGKQKLRLQITSGEYKGKTVEITNYVTRLIRLEGKTGTRYIIDSYDGFITANIMSYERSGIIVFLALLFIGLVILFGRKKGIAATAALLVTLMNVIFLFMPMLINGVPAILAAIIVILLSTLYTMVVLNGFCAKSLIATACCTLCTTLAGILAWLVGIIGNISTLNTAEAENLLFITEQTSFRIDNLLIAGILIAAMGAVMDTCMSIVSSLFEIKAQKPGISAKQLFRSGMNIGKDIMGTMTNTLILAFVGGSINLIVTYYMYCMPAISLLNTDFIVIEAIKGLVGSIAVVLSIPAAAFMTCAVIGWQDKNRRKPTRVKKTG